MSRYPGVFWVSQCPGVLVSWCPSVLVTECPGVPVPCCTGVPVSWCSSVLVSQFPGVPMSWWPIVMVSQCPGVPVSWCPVSWFPSVQCPDRQNQSAYLRIQLFGFLTPPPLQKAKYPETIGCPKKTVSALIKQVRGTTRCVKSDNRGQNCKICLNLIFSFISSSHVTKPQTFGTI